MRDVKFKGIANDDGRVVKGGVLIAREDAVFITEGKIDKDEKLNVSMTLIKPDSLCEFTGAFDDNNEEIYEHDEVVVVKDVFGDYKPGDEGYIGVGIVTQLDGKWHVDGTVDKFLYDVIRTNHVVLSK